MVFPWPVAITFVYGKQLQCHVKTAPTNFHMTNLLYPSESYCDEPLYHSETRLK